MVYNELILYSNENKNLKSFRLTLSFVVSSGFDYPNNPSV